ncbi:non-ribosomal peptide synthetase [Pseudomonas sp. CGJS7]|uniref:non-ribosomal peptide synthetase n=1 Tax=Pseudomonas sp. CGJS7 TaxID=3109348 RepID=UPI0030089E8E
MQTSIKSILGKLGGKERARLYQRGQALGLREADAGRIVSTPRDGELPLSFAQQRLWFLAQLEGVSVTYHIPLALRLHGTLDRDALRQALDRLLARHEGLRTVFIARNGQPRVRLLPADTALGLPEHDLRGSDDAHAALQAIADEELHAPFDLSRGPLIRARLIRLGENEHELLITLHHIAADGWSIAILARELGELYNAAHGRRADSLPALAIQYPDYAAWQRQWLDGDRLDAQTDYWRNQLADAPVLLELPTDRPRPAQQCFAAAEVALHLEPELTHALQRLSRRHGGSLFMTLLAAWSAVLARLSGHTDLIVGTPSANRNRAEIQPLIGFFVNTLALRIDLSGDPSVAELLARVRAVALAAQDHQDLPFERVVEAAQPPRRLDHTPLFQVLFAWQTNEAGVFAFDGLRAEPPRMAVDTLRFDLELHLSPSAASAAGETVDGTLYYSTALFDRSTIERQRDCLIAMLRAMVADDARSIADIDVVGADERALLLARFNRGETAAVADTCVHRMFEQQVERTPDAIALVHDHDSLSYRQLDTLANRLAHRLIAQGLRPGQPVAICAGRGAAMVAALIAILKAGGAYLPLDPDYPAERLAQVLAEAQPALLLGDAAGRRALGDAVSHCAHALDLDRLTADAFTADDEAHENPGDTHADADRPAYLIYTSGSTGVPKGVAMPHRPLVNLLRWQNRQLPPAQTTLQFAALGFDVAFQEIFGTLCAGGILVSIDAQLRLDFGLLIARIARERVQRLHLPYIALQALAEAAADDPARIAMLSPALRDVVVAGEQLRITPQIRRLFQQLPDCRLHNHYGPTESHVVTAYTLPPTVEAWPDQAPIGRPIDNARIYLLDPRGRPAPLGAVGEIHIGGAVLAQGYWNREALTRERFIADPFADTAGARMYRSGDLARYRGDGELIFLGRNDDQIKIRGFRIELGEIEARLAEHPELAETAVLAREDGGDKRLVAYVVPAAAGAPRSGLATRLRAHLSARLPDYMVPSAFVAVDALPQTPNGKLDRKRLPAPDRQDLARYDFQAPLDGPETTLAALWSALLGVERIGRDDHFFELGGHSLLAAQLAARIGAARDADARERGAVPVRQVFLRPVLKDMAELLRAPADAVSAVVDLRQEIQLAPDIRAALPHAAPLSPRQVLLTGATGFLGAFLLTRLLRRTDARVHCLIRCDDAGQGLQRLRRGLNALGLNPPLDPERIVVLPGDLAQPRLGLSERRFAELAQSLDAIYHNGAWVNSLHNYRTLKAANVLATEQVLRLASLGAPKHIHYVSTTGVLPPLDPAWIDVRNEEDLFARWQGLSAGYTQSKWVAEQLLRLGGSRGLGYTVYRPTHICGAADSGISNDSDTWSLFVDACLRHRAVPDQEDTLNWVPVDRMSEFIVELSLRQDTRGRTLNLTHPRAFALSRLIAAIAASDGAPVRSLAYRDWLSRCASDESTRNIASILPADLAEDPSVATAFGAIRIGNAVEELGGLDVCPPLDDALLRRYVDWRNRPRGGG